MHVAQIEHPVPTDGGFARHHRPIFRLFSGQLGEAGNGPLEVHDKGTGVRLEDCERSVAELAAGGCEGKVGRDREMREEDVKDVNGLLGEDVVFGARDGEAGRVNFVVEFWESAGPWCQGD